MDDQPAIPEFAPWAHPKAQAWFELVFERSGLVESLLTAVESPTDPLTPAQQRLLAAVCMLLGRPGIWPAHQSGAFQKLVLALLRNRRLAMGEAAKPVTMAEHQARMVFNESYEIELESLRRRVGLSKKVNRLQLPRTWQRFWY